MTNTTNYISQLPGELNIEMTDDNDLVFSIDWHMDLTDYEFDANIIPKDCEADEIPMTVEVTSLTGGKMNITVTTASILDLTPSTNKWYLNWTTPAPESYVRTVLAGAFVLRSK